LRDWAEATADHVLTREVIQFVVESGQSKIPSSKATTAIKVQARSEAFTIFARLWDHVVSKESTYWDELRKAGETVAACQDVYEKLNSLLKAYESEFGEFLKLAATYVKPWSGKREFFQELENIERSKRRPAQSGNFHVRILTLQSSKGLQADSVYVVGLEDGQFPGDCSASEIAEQARLLFVAMTRAQDKLHLFHARKREGSISFRNQSHQLQESRFLKVLPIPKENRKYHPPLDKTKRGRAARSNRAGGTASTAE
jgi:superfamily I DNA/RNA helicase